MIRTTECRFRCSRHPKYKAVKYPPSQCYHCVQLWQLNNSLKRGWLIQCEATKSRKIAS